MKKVSSLIMILSFVISCTYAQVSVTSDAVELSVGTMIPEEQMLVTPSKSP